MDASTKHERLNPLNNANPFSRLTFFWMRGIFWKGMKKELEQEDLYNPMQDDKSELLGDKLEKNWQKEVELSKTSGKDPSLLKAIVKTFWGWYLVFASLLAVQTLVIKIMQPLLLSRLLKYFAAESTTPIRDAYGYAGGILICSFLQFMLIHHYGFGVYRIGMRMRIACCSLLYRKVLKLNVASMGATATGQVVNLMSNDVARFDNVVWLFTYLWLMPIQLPIVAYLLWYYIGWAGFIGIGFILIQSLPLQAVMGKLSAKLRMMIALRTDERVRLMSEIISGIQVIKMYAWEKPFAKLVELARRREINVVTKASYLRGVYLSFIMFNERASLCAALISYVLLGNEISAEKVFAASSLYNVMNQMLALYLPNSITMTSETLVSIKRMQMFLMQEEIQRPATQVSPGGEQAGVTITRGTAKWSQDTAQDTLRNIDLRVKPGQLCAVIGQVGSGKSSLFHAILGELPLQTGSLQVGGTLSYASQEPWLFTGSVRSNILFGQTYDAKKYREVVKVCALVRDFELFPYGDKTLVGDRGVSLSGGQKARINLARCVYKEADVYLLDDPLSAVDAHVGKHLFKECITRYLREKSVILATHQLHLLKHIDHIAILENGSILQQGTYDEMVKSGLDFAQLLGSEGEDDEKTREKKASQGSRHKKMSLAINPSASQRIRGISVMSTASSMPDEQYEAPVEIAEMRTEGDITWASYKDYFRAGGNMCFIFIVVFMVLFTQVNVSGVDYFVSYWTKEEEQYNRVVHLNGTATYNRSMSQETSMIVYGCIVIALTFISVSRSMIFFKLCMRASIGLHNKMFTSILRATMHFFDTNPSGRILNRFSKDMGSVDELLPKAMIEASQVLLMMTGVLVLVLVASYYLIVPMFVVGVLFFLIRIVYLHTARNVKRLEGITRSPVFNHLSSTLNGLTTIRASQAEELIKQEFDSHQNLHTSAWFLYVASSTTFGFSLDFLSSLFTGFVSFSFLILSQKTFGSNVGMAISQSISLTGMLQYGIKQSAEVVNQMTSVERVLEYTHVEKESQIETKPPKLWPTKGEVKFNKMFLRYTPDDPPVLKDLTLTIKPKQKVGIVGRTGAGKSSLIAALFRLARQEGEILIDGVDTSHIGLSYLRSSISIIPQEPVLFSASIRENLDPFNQYEDHQLWSSLEEVELKEAVDSLEFHVNEGGSNFSVGQRQLVCLARAILRNNHILVLDEATANVDPQTDALIQNTIRRRFAECTVLTIAHRLNTIMDSDMVLVMDAGKMVEFDAPHVLLQKGKGGYLWSMVQETGPDMAKHLANVAKEAYNGENGVGEPSHEEVTDL